MDESKEIIQPQLLQDELEYLQVKGDFFEDQTEMWFELIYKQELKAQEILKEERELLDKFNEREFVKEKLISQLKALKDQVNNGKEVKKEVTALIRINGFFNCPECPYKSINISHLKDHINAIHLKIKPWKCLECHKGWFVYLKLFLIYGN